MRKLVYAAVVGLALMTTGCEVTVTTWVDCIDFPNDPDCNAQFDVVWLPGTNNGFATPSTCPPNATAEVVSENVSQGIRYVDLYNCEDGGGVTHLLAPGDYDVYVNVYDTTQEELLWAVSGTVLTDAFESEIVDVDAYVTWGFANFDLAWTIDGDLPDTTTCNNLGATGGVSLDATLVGTTALLGDIWDCDDAAVVGGGSVLSDEYPLGDWTLSFALLDADELALGVSAAVPYTLDLHEETVQADLDIVTN